MIPTTTLFTKTRFRRRQNATEVQSGFYARRFWNVQSRLALHRILVSDIRATKKLCKRGRHTCSSISDKSEFSLLEHIKERSNSKNRHYAKIRYGRGKDMYLLRWRKANFFCIISILSLNVISKFIKLTCLHFIGYRNYTKFLINHAS